MYDPVGMPNLEKVFKDQVTYECSIAATLQDADACFIFTEWAVFKELDLQMFKVMREPRVYDGRNCFSLEKASQANIQYYSIGRKKVGGFVCV